MIFQQTFRNFGRIREIIAILMKYGFEDFVVNTPLFNYLPNRTQLKWTREGSPINESNRYERIRIATEELGPTFIKLAQVLSNRPDLLPDELITELEKLQSSVPPFEFKYVRSIIKSETGKEIEELFTEFDESPIGSASIGQVHRARLFDGTEVVVKVQRPGVKRVIETDLSILRYLVVRGDNYLRENGVLNGEDVVNAFDQSMQKEMDYRNEGRNIEAFRNFYKNYKDFYIPRVYREYTTEKVLVIEYIRGCKITDVKQLKAWGLDPRKIAERGMKIYLMQMFEFGYFHADPHPGNVLIRPDGIICLIDFGMVGKLMRKDKYAFAGIFVAMANKDAKATAINLRKLAIDDEINDMRQFEYDIASIIDDFSNMDVGESSIVDMNTRLSKLMYEYKLRVPGGVYLLFRVLAILEGIGKVIHPEFRTDDFVKPYGVKLLKEQLEPKYLVQDLYNSGTDLISFLNGIPNDLKSILKQSRKGRFTVRVEHTGYAKILDTANRTINRLILTLIIVALIFAAALTVDLHNSGLLGSQFFGVSYLSILIFGTAVVLGLILLYNVLRSRKY
jgi:ubiquinone biosynthesis protein